MNRWVRVAAAMAACIGMSGASAQSTLRIGMVAGFTGPVAGIVQESAEGAKLYFDSVNAQGGIKGQNIELVTADDRYNDAAAVAQAKALAGQGVIALMLSRGTGPTEAMLPVLKENKLALVAPATGAMDLREPVQPYVFHLRASYQKEAERAVKHLAGIGVKRITIVQVNDPFGNDAGKGAIKGLDDIKLRAMSNLRFDRNKPELAPTMQAIAKAGIEAVVLIGPGYAVVEGVKALREADSTAHIATLSNNASTEFVKELGKDARGVIVTQLFPYERSTANLMVREALLAAKAAGRNELTPAHLEGYAAAKLVVETLKRAGKDISRESFLKALDGARFDLGGLQVHYTDKDHNGLDFTDVSIVGEDGKFRR
ncbi:ABC transporter substrate-binding protein [Pelomonas cellulosilytica]|uniref:ABC transporter substrate-binding protein n=1 Tax=Pelomonas cellulosilytica TaxID=2906762 RepID=A0ABS8XXD9_9BURK|nr:ABC transporter substrate-binding protein [Pelomonas sp. P8]MCE4556628.1 ABC transporter substrate-binding protein [Pelomonas sp. P8]